MNQAIEFSWVPARRLLSRLTATATLLVSALSVAACGDAASQSADTASEEAAVVVYKTPWCGCCTKWVEQLRGDGLVVETIDVESTAPVRDELGVPRAMGSCHTARVGEYWVEGHVPVDLVRKLAEEQPEGIRGLAVPGMPIGSPGMEGPNPQRYAVFELRDDGKVAVHDERMGVSEAPR